MKVFISYRRSDEPGGVGRLFDYLEARFGKGKVFLDVDSAMPLGVDFREHIAAQVEKADVVLAVIGPRWLKTIQDKADDPTDFVRLEIEAALRQGKPLVPVLMGGNVPAASELPSSIGQLAYLNGMPVDMGADFRHHATKFCDKLEAVANSQPAQAPSSIYAGWRWHVGFGAVLGAVGGVFGGSTLGFSSAVLGLFFGVSFGGVCGLGIMLLLMLMARLLTWLEQRFFRGK